MTPGSTNTETRDPSDSEDSSAQTDLTIGAVAQRVGIATSVIRYYETMGLLPPPPRLNGRRRYDVSTVQRLRVIGRAQQAGFTLGEIRELFFGFEVGTPPSVRWEALARRKLVELDAQIARISAMQELRRDGLQCGCLTIEQCTVWLSGLETTAK
jgi:MerR family transcriptional regulator, redox-sensitive transcriptional activator SoxR